MKILIISPGFLPTTGKQGGAIEKLIENYLDYNEKIGDKIVLYTVKTAKDSYDKKPYKNTEYRIIDKTTLKFRVQRMVYGLLDKLHKDYSSTAYIREVIKDIQFKKEENEYDAIIFENGQNFIPYFKNKTNTKSRIVLHLHNDYVNVDRSNSKLILDNCDEVWAVSNFIKNRVKEVKPSVKAEVLYNTIDISMFKREISEQDIIKTKESLGISDEFVFLYVGRLIPAKGVKELIEAFNNVNKKYEKAKLVIVGGNSDHKKDSYIKDLENTSAGNKNIVFTGFINSKEIYKYYALADVQVVPSKWNEAFGLIILEGMTWNLPIIASNSGGIPEVLGEDGIYVSTNNLVKELEDQMINILLSEEDNVKQYTANYEKTLNRFSLENYCIGFKKLLNKEK